VKTNLIENEIMREDIDELIYQSYLGALLAGDRTQCASIVHKLMAADANLKDMYIQLFQRSLYQIGEMWEMRLISVAVEHLATAITERMLSLVQAQVFDGPPRSQSIIVTCIAGEHHQIGARMAADLCELLGWRGYFLGANTPLPDLLQLIEERRPTMLGLSLCLGSQLPTLLKSLDTIRSASPDLPILLGGQAFRRGGMAAVQAYPNVSCLSSLDELEQRIRSHEQ